MGRFLALVTGLAAAGFSLGPSQILRTPSTGARYANRVPSGLIRGFDFSALPNRSRRGISGAVTGVSPWTNGAARNRQVNAATIRSGNGAQRMTDTKRGRLWSTFRRHRGRDLSLLIRFFAAFVNSGQLLT